jgi:DNA-binding transcriptional regulator GbsR (MarR family)
VGRSEVDDVTATAGDAVTGPGGASATDAARDPAAVLRFVERFTSLLGQSGFPRMPARVFVALLVTDSGSLTAAELADTLRVSPAAISSSVRYLIQVGLASREREPGSRRDRYWVPDDIWYEVLRVREQVTARWVPTLQEGIEALGPGTPAAERLAETADFFEFLRKEAAELHARWQLHRASLPGR